MRFGTSRTRIGTVTVSVTLPCALVAVRVKVVVAETKALEWSFRFNGGVPDRLVWSTDADQSYNLWFTDRLSAPFVQVGGYRSRFALYSRQSRCELH